MATSNPASVRTAAIPAVTEKPVVSEEYARNPVSYTHLTLPTKA